jgi:hypothetical protein
MLMVIAGDGLRVFAWLARPFERRRHQIRLLAGDMQV